jgi:murein DD-endopeptidase MepM/ murein hydrolase activator NlpD
MRATIAGSGLFTGLMFAPLVPELREGNFIVRDFTQGLCEPLLAETGFKFDVGRYNERRRSMYESELFGEKDPWSEDETRDIHVGVDIGGVVGTPIHVVADGHVHSCGYNPAQLDYGHVIISEHELNGRKVWALHGHLSAQSVVGKRSGDRLVQGDVLGWIGDEHENGGWPPHVHFQLSLVEPATHDLPGVVSASQHAQALVDYPDPRGACTEHQPASHCALPSHRHRDAAWPARCD